MRFYDSENVGMIWILLFNNESKMDRQRFIKRTGNGFFFFAVLAYEQAQELMSTSERLWDGSLRASSNEKKNQFRPFQWENYFYDNFTIESTLMNQLQGLKFKHRPYLCQQTNVILSLSLFCATFRKVFVVFVCSDLEASLDNCRNIKR